MKSSSNYLMAIIAGALALADAVAIRTRAASGVEVNFKETTICETTPGVKAYSGYVTLPATLDYTMPYESKMYFWFFEARNSPATAPLTMWLQGGPGSASIDQAVSGHSGPCIVNPDSKTTSLNPNSWTEVSNMIYIDQPVQTGFSTDGQVKTGALNTLTGDVDPPADGTSWLEINGNFSSQDPTHMVNTTLTSARAIYHLMQAFFDEFEQYKRDNISIWSQSYGGHFAPGIASLINQEKAKPGSVLGASRTSVNGNNTSHTFGVDSIGIINGMIDLLTQITPIMNFAVNNTYGIKSYDDATSKGFLSQITAPGGCLELATSCQKLISERDVDGFATDSETVETCGAATNSCLGMVLQSDALSGHYTFDIAQPMPLGFPFGYELGWLNSAEVQEALGVPVNYTRSSNVATNVFLGSGDLARSFNNEIGTLLDQGVKVALIHGDRDFRCNWVSGEAVSLVINYTESVQFAAAGYTDIELGGTAVGSVRQHKNFSFTRLYNAGHEAPLYKPAESLEIFRRTIQGKDVATGQVDTAGYSSSGPSSCFDIQFPAEPVPAAMCYVLDAPIDSRCNADQLAALQNKTAVVKDYIVITPPAV